MTDLHAPNPLSQSRVTVGRFPSWSMQAAPAFRCFLHGIKDDLIRSRLKSSWPLVGRSHLGSAPSKP